MIIKYKKLNENFVIPFQAHTNDGGFDVTCTEIIQEDEDFVISAAKSTIKQQYNEMHASLLIFDKYWPDMTDNNRKAIWNHMKVLVLLCEKAKGL